MSIFTNLQKELGSWFAPSKIETASVPEVGSRAPSGAKLPVPGPDGKPTIITFLRHCGCPFAEKTFITFRELAATHKDINFVAVSHSDQASTDKWAEAVGGTGDVKLIVDFEREIYASWGLGITGWKYMWDGLGGLGPLKQEGITNRWTESGSRWQSSGSFAADGKGTVKWSKPAENAGDMPNFDDALSSLKA